MSLIKNEYTLTVDLKKPTTNIRPRFIQYDTAILYFKVYDNGKDFNFSEQTEIQVAHKKKSGKTEVGRATVVTGNDGKPLIKYEYMGSEMNEVGNVTTSVSILSGKKKVTIQPFIVEIIKDIHSGVVDNVNKEYSLLQQLITTVEGAVKSAIDSANLVKDAVDDASLALESATALKESWKYLDAFDLTKSYKKNNVVSYNGSSFIALVDNIGKTPVGDINDLNWRLVAKKGADGNGTVVLYSDIFQGKKGQTVFNLSREYDQMQNRIHLVVGGIVQHSPLDFMETSSNKVTLNYPLEDDMRVVAVYFGEAPAITNDLQVQIDSIREIVQVFDLVEIMNKGDYAKTQGDYAKQQGDIAKSRASEALTAKQATETATSKVTTAISDLTQLKSTLGTATTNANSATQSANNSATLATQSANNAQFVADNTVSSGAFVLSKAYKKNNLVLNQGTTWMALKDTIFNPLPILPASENEFWRLVAQRGVDGRGSVSSVNGIQPNIDGDVLLGVPDVEGLQGALDELQAFIKKEAFVSTANQTVFTLTKGTYMVNENRVEAEVGGVPQFSPINFVETNETTITFKEPLKAGMTVVITYYSDFHPIRTDVEGRLIDLENDVSNVKADIVENVVHLEGLESALGESQEHLVDHINDKDNPHNVTKEQVGLGNVQDFSIATQEEAESGTSTTKYMTPLGTKQLVDKTLEDVIVKDEIITSDGKTITTPIKSPVNVKRIDGKTIINHAPLFDSGVWVFPSNHNLLNRNELVIGTEPTNNIAYSGMFSIKPNTTYFIQGVSSDTANGRIDVDLYDSSKNYIKSISGSFNSGNAVYAQARCVVFANAPFNVTFSNIQLTEGSQSLPFVANIKGLTNPTIVNETNDTSLVIPTTLYDGEYVEQNVKGELVKHKKLNEITLDKLTFGNVDKSNTFKRLITRDLSNYRVGASNVVKYNGSILVNGDTNVYGDCHALSAEGLFITIPNSDSGWGSDYTPTDAEIKAYILGWKMYDSQTGATPYNRTDAQFKAWSPIGNELGYNGTYILPTTQIINTSKWQPYRLIYELATPVQEIIKPYGDLTLEKGENTLKVRSGRIVNERVTPLLDGTDNPNRRYNINNGNAHYEKSLSKYKVNKFLKIFKNNILDTQSWILYPNNITKAGSLAQSEMTSFNPTASYTVDYEPLNKWEVTAPIDNVQLQYFESLTAVVNELTLNNASQQDTLNRMLDNVVNEGSNPNFLEVSLTTLNGWLHLHPLTISKDHVGNISVTGSVWGGTTATDTIVTILPIGFRPKNSIIFAVANYDYTNTVYPSTVVAQADGQVIIKGVKHNAVLSLSNIKFKI